MLGAVSVGALHLGLVQRRRPDDAGSELIEARTRRVDAAEELEGALVARDPVGDLLGRVASA